MDTIPGQPSFSERFFTALGKPVPPPPTEEQLREWEADDERVDAELRRIYGGGATPTAT